MTIRLTTFCTCGWTFPDVVLDSERADAHEDLAEMRAAITAHGDKRHARASSVTLEQIIRPEGDSDA